MCDQDHFYEDLKKYTRRDVGTFAAAIGVVAMLPRSAFAVDTKESNVTIKTPDGECDAYFVTPTTGAHAAVLVWPDIFGLRPALREMGKRLAGEGYSVLVVNPFYRQQKAPTAPQGAQTPIHDHLAWGLIGVYRGIQDETVYRRTDDGRDESRAQLEVARRQTVKPGEFYTLLPPLDDIHYVKTVSDTPSISIHLLANDTACVIRHRFDAVSGVVTPFRSGYSNAKCVER